MTWSLKKLIRAVRGSNSSQTAAANKQPRLSVEALEDRFLPAVVQPLFTFAPPAGGSPTQSAQLSYILNPSAGNFQASRNGAVSLPGGLTPSQIRTAYGINNILFGQKLGTGAGQTIAIIDATNDPNILSDLDTFDKTFTTTGSGRTLFSQYSPASAFLKVFDQFGNRINPVTNTTVPRDTTGSDAIEIALDVEWAHAIAPGAAIDLIEANSLTYADLFQGVTSAAKLPGVSVVSMSFGGPESSQLLGFDSTFTTPKSHQGVTFVASTGDSGSSFYEYPAASPNVVAVGGTTLNLNPNGSIASETAWSGTGGGTSAFEVEPSYQKGVQNTGFRTTPDVAFDANPNTGVDVFDSYHNPDSQTGWLTVGGTSLSAPSWAGLFAITNQGRVLAGGKTLDGPTQTLPALYRLPSGDFNDITSGSNGAFSAGPGYDEVTGLGTPRANLLVPDLAHFGLGAQAQDQLVVTTQPGNIVASQALSLVVKVEDPFGNVVPFTGGVTVTLASNPDGGSLSGQLTATEDSTGAITLSGLTIEQVGTGYSLRVSGLHLTSVTTATFNVTASLTAQSEVTPERGNTSVGDTLSAVVAGNSSPT